MRTGQSRPCLQFPYSSQQFMTTTTPPKGKPDQHQWQKPTHSLPRAPKAALCGHIPAPMCSLQNYVVFESLSFSRSAPCWLVNVVTSYHEFPQSMQLGINPYIEVISTSCGLRLPSSRSCRRFSVSRWHRYMVRAGNMFRSSA